MLGSARVTPAWRPSRPPCFQDASQGSGIALPLILVVVVHVEMRRERLRCQPLHAGTDVLELRVEIVLDETLRGDRGALDVPGFVVAACRRTSEYWMWPSSTCLGAESHETRCSAHE